MGCLVGKASSNDSGYLVVTPGGLRAWQWREAAVRTGMLTNPLRSVVSPLWPRKAVSACPEVVHSCIK